MSVSEAVIFKEETESYSLEKAKFIALEVATGASLAELHELHPDRIPNPIVVNRWRKRFPAFDVLMGEAEVCAAQKWAWETVKIADDEDLLAAQAGNAIKARQWLAGKLHEAYGAAQKAATTVHVHNNSLALSDEQLLEIAGGAYIEGELSDADT